MSAMALLMIVPAIVGLVAGMVLWIEKGRGRHTLTLFMGASSVLGLVQSNEASTWNARGVVLCGDLWELAVLTLLVPSLLRIMRRPARTVMVPLTVLSMAVWAYFFIGLGYLSDASFHHFLSVWIHLLLAAVAYVVVGQCFDDSRDLIHNACFVRSMACLTAGAFDAANNYVRGLYLSIDPTLCSEFKTVRDVAWFAAYILLAYSIMAQKRAPRSQWWSPLKDRRQAPREPHTFKEVIHG